MTRDLTSYTYVSQPHSAPRVNSQTLPTRGGSLPLTMMSDPRVVRGNTHSLARKISKAREEEETKQSLQTKYRGEDSSGSNNSADFPLSSMPSYKFAVKSFGARGIDIDQYLVDENEEKYVVKQRDVDTQADELLPRSETPPHIPAKTGVDKSTQVEDTNDLFHFDVEVKPMLEVIIQKTLQQALMEVEAEYELVSLQQAVRQFESQQEEEANWMRQEEQSVKNEYYRMRQEIEEKTRRKEEEKAFKSGIAGVQMMRQLLPSMFEEIANQHNRERVWVEPERQFIEKEVLPQLLKQVNQYQNSRVAAETLIDDLLLNAQQTFDEMPNYSRVRQTKKLQISINLSGGSGEGEEGDEASGTAVVKNSVLVDMVIHEDDTIKSLQIAFVSLLNAINTRQSLSIPTNLSLLDKFQNVVNELRLQQGISRVDIPEDAQILNFPIHQDLVFDFKV